jgi:hypothetical protein
VLALDVTSDWTDATIAVSAKRKDGRVGVEVYQHFEGSTTRPIEASDVIRAVSAFAEKQGIEKITYLHSSPLAPEIERHKAQVRLPYEAMTSQGMLHACDDLLEAVGSRRIAHNDPLLDGQMSYAARRLVGGEGAWRWAISMSGGPITAVQAATLAYSVGAKAKRRAQIW